MSEREREGDVQIPMYPKAPKGGLAPAVPTVPSILTVDLGVQPPSKGGL